MTDETAAPGEPTAVYQISGEGPLSLSEAANAIANAREQALTPEKPKKDEAPATPSEPPQAEADAAPPEEAPGEETEATDPAEELPPIEPPRSWSKEDKELFNALPRETQERVSERERARENDFLRRQQQAAEQRKAFEVERQKAAQARQQYEQTVPQLLTALQAQISGEFADIKSWADVEKMATEDPFRYQRFDVAVKKAQAMQQQMNAVQVRQAHDMTQRWSQFSQAEDAKFMQQAPEMSDASKAKEIREKATKTLQDLGFKNEELAAAWEGKTGVSLRDHRLQLLIRDATLYREAQAKAKTVRQAPVPPVQRPGTARSSRPSNDAEISSVTKELESATGRRAIELATKLQQLKRPAKR